MAWFIQEEIARGVRPGDAPGGGVVVIGGKPVGHIRGGEGGTTIRLVGQPGTGDPGTGFATQADAEAYVATWDSTARRKRVVGFVDQ